MNIAIVWKNDYPWDIRVEKMGKTLSAFGHEVHIIARNLRKEGTEENVDGICVHRLSPLKPDLLNSASSIPAFFNPRWNSAIKKVCMANKIDLIIVRDLPLVVNGLAVGRKLGIPVFFDMAELYSAMWKWLSEADEFKLSNFFLKNPRLAKHLEKYSIRSVDHIFTVVDEARSCLIELGADKNKISIVSNTPDLSTIEKFKEYGRAERWKDKIVLLYHGYIDSERGLRAVISSMPSLIGKFNNLHLVLIGTGMGIDHFKALCRELNVEEYVEFPGWLNFEQIPPLIKAADICIIPHLANKHTDTTIPNKLFDYMVCGKPVVVSDAKPLKRIVETEKCGLTFKSGDSESFIEAIARMIRDPSMAKKMGRNGLMAVKREYNWGHDSRVLINVIENFKKPEPAFKTAGGHK